MPEEQSNNGNEELKAGKAESSKEEEEGKLDDRQPTPEASAAGEMEQDEVSEFEKLLSQDSRMDTFREGNVIKAELSR